VAGDPGPGGPPGRTGRTDRQRATVEALLDAALEHLRAEGDAGLTVRAVARRAGVTHTTAYAYFATREHLVAEAYWRGVRHAEVARPEPAAPLAARVAAAVAGPVRVAAEEPALARAGLTALLADVPEVAAIRAALGADVAHRLRVAVGDGASTELVEVLATAYTGAMLQAGTGHFPFATVVERMTTIASLLRDP
jgi:AcrR family transcriptional regulator